MLLKDFAWGQHHSTATLDLTLAKAMFGAEQQ